MNLKLSMQIFSRHAMKKLQATILLFFIMIFGFNTPSASQSSIDSDVKRAKAFMAARMYPEAIELLNNRISNKPTDVEAHFQLGICYLHSGLIKKANNQFINAVELTHDYRYTIGSECKKIGDDALNSGNYGWAKSLYQLAIKYHPNLKGKIARDCYDSGRHHFNYKNYGPADSIFTLATDFDSSFNQQVSEMFFNLGNSVDSMHCIEYYRISSKYSSLYNQKIGLKLVELAMVPMAPEADKKIYKVEASKYLSKAEMKEAFSPD